MGNSDGATPEEQIKQILNIAPIITGSRRASKYDIPPHHPHHEKILEEPTNGNTNNTNQVEVETLDPEKELIDFGEADLLGPVGLIPITRGVSIASRSTRLEPKHKGEPLKSGSGVSSLSPRPAGSASEAGRSEYDNDSDEFVDAEER